MFRCFTDKSFRFPGTLLNKTKQNKKTKRRIDGGLKRKPGKNIKEKRRKISRVVDLM
jgi:hypothetical protein